MTSSHWANISTFPRGIYFAKIGNKKAMKFLKLQDIKVTFERFLFTDGSHL